MELLFVVSEKKSIEFLWHCKMIRAAGEVDGIKEGISIWKDVQKSFRMTLLSSFSLLTFDVFPSSDSMCQREREREEETEEWNAYCC